MTTTLLESDGYQRHFADASVLRSALASDDAKALLRDLFKLRYDQQVYAISARSTLDGIVRTIRRYDPDITLPVESIGLLGSATEYGWERSVTMRPSRDDPNSWSVEVSLIDGEIKFRADDDWSTDWGAPITLGVSDENPFTFVGDLATVFPHGIAEFKGLNIPVDAGRYRVTFNSQSFNYSFERIDDAP